METSTKFRYTKQLIAMALRDGWTQKSIAEACRTQQSVVSDWKSGARMAKTDQLKKLLDQYGPRLRRKTFRIYHHFSEHPEQGLVPHLIKVEGEIILAFPYDYKTLCPQCHQASGACTCRNRSTRSIASRKLIVHAMGNGEFCCVLQERYQMRFPDTNLFTTEFVGRFNSRDLLAYVDASEWMGEREDKVATGAESLMLKTLARKALLEHGVPVDGVEEHFAAW